MLFTSVISNSPRDEGVRVLMNSNTSAGYMYTPTTARLDGGSVGFSMIFRILSSFTSAMPYSQGWSTSVRNTMASSLGNPAKSFTPSAMPCSNRLSPNTTTTFSPSINGSARPSASAIPPSPCWYV